MGKLRTSTTLSRRGFLAASGTAAAIATGLLAGCAQQEPAADTEPEVQASGGIDYLVLVNKQHQLPDGWEDALELAEEESLIYTNDDGTPYVVQVERKAYEAYQALKEDLAADDVFVELDSCYRSVADQQAIVDEFTKEYGEEYVKKYVAVPGYSEHHTGLALDLFLVIDGENVYLNEEMVQHPEVWEKVHAKLADHGFILRYLPGKKICTGYSYEPWHIRYLDDADVAHQIMDADLTFEEYLDEVEPVVAGCVVDYGASELYSEPDMDAALDVILAEFRTWDGCVMQRFAFAGDAACDDEEVAYLNELREARGEDEDQFAEGIVFVTDFHTGTEEETEKTAWEADADYTDYTWHLGRSLDEETGEAGAWQLMTWGYA